MIAHVAAATGWTWDYIAENLDLPRVADLNAYWRRYPPVHILLAAYVGYRAADADDADEVQAMEMLGAETLSAAEFDALLRERNLGAENG